jgi:hypothetical protein
MDDASSTGMKRLHGFIQRVHRIPGVPAAAFLAGFLFLFQPAQVYRGNGRYFFYGFPQLSLVLIPLFLAAFALLAVLAGIGRPRWRQVVAATLTGLGVASWASATFFTKSVGQLDGRNLLELAGGSGVRWHTAGYVGLFLIGAAAAYRVPALVRRFLSAMFLVLAAFTLWLAASDPKPWRAFPALERLATFSAERNVLVILLDGFQSDFFVEVAEKEPRVAPALEGFTFLPNATGSALTTYLSLPTIHSGVALLDGRGLRSAYQTQVVQGSFVAKLAQAGYDAMVVNALFDACPLGALCDHADQLTRGQAVPVIELSLFLVNLSVFRAAPDAVRPTLYRHGTWWTPWQLHTKFARTSNGVLDLIARDAKSGAAAPTVRFLHLLSSHPPATFDAACVPVSEPPWTRETAIAQDRCAMLKVLAVLDSLRARGLYDQTAIIILADHGAGLPRDVDSAFPFGAGAGPLLLVKPFGAKGPLRTLNRVAGLADIAATVCAWTAACPSTAGADILGSPERAPNYSFVTYAWGLEFLGADEVPLENRFEVRGPPASVSSWWRVTNLPAKGLSQLDFSKDDPADAYGFGWSPFEVWAGEPVRWAVGLEADLYLPLDAACDQQLVLELATHAGNLAQNMTVEVNGSPVAEQTVSSAWSAHDIRVPKELIGRGPARVLFRFLQANPPGPGDTRRLAVLFRKLTVHPAL